MKNDFSILTKKCYSIKRRFLSMYFAAQAGHVGCSLSCAELLTYVKFGCMSEEDTLVLSKGHAAAALYSVLVESGEIAESEVASFYKDSTLLAGHPPPNKIPGIPFATGSLGHGAGLATGLALANKLQQPTDPHHVYCILSDGELNEGSSWEAFAFASHHELTRLHFLVDRNMIQGFGFTEDVQSLEPLVDRFASFGLCVMEVDDGHCFAALNAAHIEGSKLAEKRKRPLVIIARTSKGRGLPNQDSIECHYLPMRDNDYEAVMHFCEQEVSGRLARYA